MPISSKVPTTSEDDAKRLLKEIIIHNRVTYGEEVQSSDWLVGFYLNTAEERIVSIASSWKVMNAAIENCAKSRNDMAYRHRTPYRVRWKHALAALKSLIKAAV
jgi:hypothetical protein